MCSRSCFSFRSPLPFYRLKEEGLHAWGISEAVYSPPPWSGGEQWVFPVAERCGAWHKLWSSSLRILAPKPGARPYPVAPGDGVVIAVEVRRALRRMWWGVEGAEDSGLSPVKGCTVSEGRHPRPPRVLQGEKYTRWAAQWRTVIGKSVLCVAYLPRAGNSGTVAGAG